MTLGSDSKKSVYFALGMIAVLVIAFIASSLFTPAQSDDILVINRSGGNTSSTDCINVGSGSFIVKNSTDNCYIRSVVGSADISVTQQTNTITIDYNGTSSGGVTSITNGTGISVNQTTGDILITNTAPDNTVCANVGSGSQVYKDGECNFRTLMGSSDISVTQQSNTITIDYNGSSGVTSLTSGNDAIVLSGSTGAITITPEWQLLCEDIASSGDTSLNCSTFVSHRYYYIITYQRIQTSTATLGLQINGDSGNNYAFRFSTNNGAETTTTNTNQCLTTGSLNNGQFGETLYQFSNNESGQEKTGYGQTSGVTASGAGNAPYRVEIACKWANTANNITDFDMVRIAGTGTLASGYLVVYGHD